MRISGWSSDVCSSDLVAVALPQMHAIRAKLVRQVHPVVQDEGDIVPRADGHQRPCRRHYLFVGSAFQPKLEGSYRPRAERRLQQVRKIAADGGWRNEVKLAGRARLALEPDRKRTRLNSSH